MYLDGKVKVSNAEMMKQQVGRVLRSLQNASSSV